MPQTPQTIAEKYTTPKPKQEKPKRRPNWKALLFVVVFFGLILVAGFLQSPLSAVSNIEVKGNHQVRYEDILRVTGIQKGMSFWRINKSAAQTEIMNSFPIVQSASVSVSWTGQVVIAVEEKQMAGTLVVKNQFYPLLQDGTVLAPMKKLEAQNVPLISMDNQVAITSNQKVASDDLVALAQQIPTVDRKVLDQVSEIHLTTSGPWVVFMRDKFQVNIPPRQFADKFKDYQKFRDALGANATPGIINLLDSNWFEPFKNSSQKGAS